MSTQFTTTGTTTIHSLPLPVPQPPTHYRPAQPHPHPLTHSPTDVLIRIHILTYSLALEIYAEALEISWVSNTQLNPIISMYIKHHGLERITKSCTLLCVYIIIPKKCTLFVGQSPTIQPAIQQPTDRQHQHCTFQAHSEATCKYGRRTIHKKYSGIYSKLFLSSLLTSI